MTTDRSARPEVRNPVLALPSAEALQQLPLEARQALAAVLLDIRRVAHGKAEASWRQRKAPMAAYWRAVAVYAGHIARATRPPAPAPHEVACGECADWHLSNDQRCPIVQGVVS